MHTLGDTVIPKLHGRIYHHHPVSLLPLLNLLSCWCCVPHCTGIVALVALSSLPLLGWHCSCPRHRLPRRIGPWSCIVVLVMLSFVNSAGIITLVALASSPLLRWHHCPHCVCCHPCPCCAGVVALAVLASLHCLKLSTCVVATVALASSIVLASFLLFHWCYCPHHAGVVAIIALALLLHNNELKWYTWLTNNHA